MTTTNLDIDAALDDVLGHDHPAAEQKAAAPERPEPYIAALPVTALFADHTYQRELDEVRVQKMAADFRIALVGIIEVSARPGDRYAILDGQHRVGVVRDVTFDSAAIRHVACRVHTGLTLAEEAKLYHELNTTRKQLTGWDRWLARRGAGDRAVLEIEACAHRHDMTIGMTTGPAIIRATKACENVVALGGFPLLDEVLETILAAYRDDQAGLDAGIIHGLGHVLHAYARDELDVARLVEALSSILPRQLTARAAAVRELHKGTLDRLTAHVIVERYNATKGIKIEPFFDRVKPTSKVRGKDARRNEAIRAWALRTGRLDEGKKNLTRSIRAAYDAAHPAGEPKQQAAAS